jgi:hypothetical protein
VDSRVQRMEPFNGIYVFDISTKGIELRGTIGIGASHPNAQSRHTWNFWDDLAQRVIFIGDTFYTASLRGMQANEMDSLKYIMSVRY